MFKLVLFFAFATLVASKPSTLISSGTSSITTEEKTEIRHVPTEVHLGPGPILSRAEILAPTVGIVQPGAVSHQFRSEIHKPMIKTTEFLVPSGKIVDPYLSVIRSVGSHLRGGPILSTEGLVSPAKMEIMDAKPFIELKSAAPGITQTTKTEIISNPLLKTSSIIAHPLTEAQVIAGSPLIQQTEILEHGPILKNAQISYVESTNRDMISGPQAVVGYAPLSKVAIAAPYAGFGADPMLIPSIGGAEILIHQPMRYL